MSESTKVDLSKAKAKEVFIAINNIESEIRYATAKDQNRKTHNVMTLSRMSNSYVPQPTDRIKYNRNGNPSLKTMSPRDLLHNKRTWEAMGLLPGRLPSLYYSDGSEACMTMNGLEIDLMHDEVIRRLDQIRNYPPSVLSESLEIISKAINKYIIVKVDTNRETSLYGAIEVLQDAKITLQNLLFEEKAEIKSEIKTHTTNIVLKHDQAVNMRQTLRLYIAMLEQAEAKVAGHGNAELADSIIDNFWDHLRKSKPTTADAVSLTHLLHSIRIDRDKNINIDLYVLLDRIVGVFKPDDEGEPETLHAALMAHHIPDLPNPRPRFEHAGGFTGTKGPGGATGKRKAEPNTPILPDTTDNLVRQLIQVVNNLKADFGAFRKAVLNQDGVRSIESGKPKKDYRAREPKERFANAAVKEKSSKPQPLTNRVMSITESDNDSDQAANFAGKDDYRILTEDNNETVLGRACAKSYEISLQQASVGSEIEGLKIDSKRTDDQLHHMKHRRVQDPIDPLTPEFCSGPFYGTIISQMFDGEEEMVVVPDDNERIQAMMNQNQKSEVQRVIMYIPIRSATNGLGTKIQNQSVTPQSEATQHVENDEFMPCPNTPSEPKTKAQECIFSPNAPQVEKYVPETSSSSTKSAQIASLERPRTRSTARAERFTIPAPRDISDDEQDKTYIVVPKPYGFSTSSYEHKPSEECTGDDERVFYKALREAQSSGTLPHLRVKGRKELGMLMAHITKAEADIESSGTLPLRHTVASTPDTTSNGAYDDLPELLSEEDLGKM